MPTKFALSSLMIISAIVPCNARSVRAPEGSISVNVASGVPVVDGVYLNGHGPYRFVLDTGEQGNQVESSIARRLGLSPTLRVQLASVTGTTLVPGGLVSEISLGSAIASNQEILFTSLKGTVGLGDGINGILGQEFLAHFDYLLDFANHRLVFGESIPGGGSRVSFENIDGRPAIETSEGKLVIDSGTNVTILYRSPMAHDGSRASTLWTASGQTLIARMQNLRLRIAGHEYHARAVSTLSSLTEKGVISATIFHAVFVSNSAKYVILDPETGRR
jgi:hypothetical protein